jgi:lipopolysaccharide export system permease protein
LGVLASQSELTVMRASGVSVLRIVWMVLRPMLVLVLFVSLLGEYVVPAIDRYASLLAVRKTGAGIYFQYDQ